MIKKFIILIAIATTTLSPTQTFGESYKIYNAEETTPIKLIFETGNLRYRQNKLVDIDIELLSENKTLHSETFKDIYIGAATSFVLLGKDVPFDSQIFDNNSVSVRIFADSEPLTTIETFYLPKAKYAQFSKFSRNAENANTAITSETTNTANIAITAKNVDWKTSDKPSLSALSGVILPTQLNSTSFSDTTIEHLSSSIKFNNISGSVTTDQIPDDSIDTAKIKDASITNADIADGISADKLLLDTISKTADSDFVTFEIENSSINLETGAQYISSGINGKVQTTIRSYKNESGSTISEVGSITNNDLYLSRNNKPALVIGSTSIEAFDGFSFKGSAESLTDIPASELTGTLPSSAISSGLITNEMLAGDIDGSKITGTIQADIGESSISNTHITNEANIDFSKLNITKENIIGLGIPGTDTDTTLSQETIDTFVEESGYIKVADVLNGDIVMYKEGWTRFPKGDNGQVLYIGSDGYPTWTDLPENIFTDITDISTAISNLGLYDLAFQDSINNTDWDGEDVSIENGGTGASTAEAARINLELGDLAIESTLNNSHWNGTELSISNGGTGASTAEDARDNLELGDLAIESTINNSHWNGTELTIANGGTGSTSASGARSNLGLGSLAISSSINGNDWDGTDLSITDGGTGSSTASGARTNLGLGTLATISSISDNNWSGTDLSIVNGGTGSSSASGARTNLGLGTLATSSSISNNNWSGTDLSIVNGGTGSSTASGARSNLGLGSLATGSSVNNDTWSGTDLSITNGGTGSSSASGARANLGLGTLATGSSVNNGNWSGTDLSVANGGTGSSSASGARSNLGLSTMATQSSNSVSITGGNIEYLSSATIKNLTITGEILYDSEEGGATYSSSAKNEYQYSGVAMMASGGYESLGSAVTITLPFNWEGGELKIWTSTTGASFQGTGTSWERIYETTYDALVNHNEDNIRVQSDYNDSIDWTTSDAITDATTTSFKLYFPSGGRIKWSVITPGS